MDFLCMITNRFGVKNLFQSIMLLALLLAVSGCSPKSESVVFICLETPDRTSAMTFLPNTKLVGSDLVLIIEQKSSIDNPDTLLKPSPEEVRAAQEQAQARGSIYVETAPMQLSGVYDFKITHNGETIEVKDFTYNGEDNCIIAQGNGWKLYLEKQIVPPAAE